MAHLSSITNRISQGVTNIDDTSIKAKWYKTNFNMPVKNFSTGTYVRGQGSFTYDTETTTYDLASFVPGYEICNGICIYDFENTDATNWDIDCYLYVNWYNTDNSTILVPLQTGYHFIHTLLPNYWIEIWFGGNIGCAPWEVDGTGIYYFNSFATGDPVISEISTAVTMQNVPSTTQLSSGTDGHIWVEGNNLAYVNANMWKHSMVGTLVDSLPGTSKAGSIWLDGTVLHWVGSDGNNYKANWEVKQFASYYSNSATGSTFAGTFNYGKIWVDNEFGWTHLAYIGNDGYKYLTGAGDNPYI